MIATWAMAMVLGVSARWGFEDAYDNLEDGAWYIGDNNEQATLAWGESYVMSGLAAMYRATGHPMYLDRLAEHADAVLEQRDDARGVGDYRGVSGACWRNLSYQDGPYCYAVHTGMIVYPMLEFVAAVESSPWAEQPSYDGETLADKAQRYLAAAQESAAFHEFEWNAAGYYEFPADATVLDPGLRGQEQPLNQSNALGRVNIMLAALTGDPEYIAKATAQAQWFAQSITVGGDGAYLWNYRSGPYAGNGEDISHAAINMHFAVLAASHGFVFDDTDVAGFATTFVERIYVDDQTFSDFVGGGSTNDPSYRAQIGRWTVLTPARGAVYTAIRDVYDRDYPPETIGNGSHLFGWGLLAEHEPKLCAPFFYSVDWDDLGDARQATAFGANILTIPADLEKTCRIPVENDTPRATVVAQWDGDAYHRVASWRPSEDFVLRHVPYEPSWPLVYWEDGVLFEFQDAFVQGDGIVVREPPSLTPPVIESSPPAEAPLDIPLDYVPVGSGDTPVWWSLIEGPSDARIDPATGAIAWTPDAPGTHAFRIRLDNDVGTDEQMFEVAVGVDADTDGASGSSTATGLGDDGVDGSGSDDGGGEATTGDPHSSRSEADGCSCRARSRPTPAIGSGLFVWVLWRRRSPRR